MGRERWVQTGIRVGRVKGRRVGGQTEVGADRNQGGQSKGKAGRSADRGGCRQESGWAE